MRASLHFEKDIVTFPHGDEMTKIPLVTERMHKISSLSDELTSNGELDENGQGIEEDQENVNSSSPYELILMLSEVESHSRKMDGKQTILSVLDPLL